MTAATQASAETWPAAGRPARPLWILAAHVAAMTVAMSPVLMVRIPALVDYLSHLARMSILATIGDRPALQEIYRVDWALLPNLVMDLSVPALAQAIGLELAGKVFVIATLASIAAGTALLHYSVHRRLELWPLAIYLFLYNGILAYGFLNYLFGIGLCLILVALWIMTRDWRAYRRLPIFVFGTLLLYFCHLAAVATFALCLGGYELWRWYGCDRRSLAQLLYSAAGTGLPFLLPLLLILASPGPAGEAGIEYRLLEGKVGAIWASFGFMNQPVDAIFGAFTAFVFVSGLSARRLRFAAALVLPAIFLTLAIIAVPTWLYDNWANDLRLAIPLVAILIAATSSRWTARQAAMVGTFALALFAVRMATIAVDWPRYDALFAEFRQAAAALPQGARIVSAIDMQAPLESVTPRRDRRPFYHLVALALLDGDHFVPTLFTAKGRQILTVQPDYEALDVPHSKPIPRAHLGDLLEPGSQIQPFGNDTKVRHYPRFAGWPYTYDYLLLIDFGQRGNPFPEFLRPFRQGTYFTLYEIRRPPRQRPAAS